MGLLDLFRKAPHPMDRSKVDGIRYQDLQVIVQMVKHGVDIKVPVECAFWLFFPTKKAATAAAAQLAARGLTTQLKAPWREGDSGTDDWTVIAGSREHALVPDFLRDTIDACEEIAAAHGGVYDGWEAGPISPGQGGANG